MCGCVCVCVCVCVFVGLAKKFLWVFFVKMLWKNLNGTFGQPNIQMWKTGFLDMVAFNKVPF